MNESDVELVDKTTTHQGYFKIERYRVRHRLYAGGMSDELVREVFDRGQVVAVLPVDVERDEVVLIEQFRAGAYAAGWDPWLLECVAGVVEAGETPIDVARRETLEEAGCELSEVEPIMRYLSSPGATSETVNLFVGKVSTEGVGGLHGLTEEGEDIRALVVTVDQALGWLDEGKILNAKTIVVLQWLALHYSALKQRWLDHG